MLVATREIIIEKLLSLSKLIDLYQSGEVGFAEKTIVWLKDTEDSLSRLRSPLTSQASRQRSRVVAAVDGFRENGLSEGRISRRKAINITASLALSELEETLVQQLQSIDQKFDLWRDKLAQFISVASNKMPIPLPATNPRQDWLATIWQQWESIEETRAMHSYLSTVMTKHDRLHLFGELIENNLTD